MLYSRNKKKENIKNKAIATLSVLANKTIDESNKNSFLFQMCNLRKNHINQNKNLLTTFSSYEKKFNINFKKEIENELLNYNKNLKQSNESLRNEINKMKEKYRNNSMLLEENNKQQQIILETLKETNFILENKLKEKEALILNINELLCDMVLDLDNIEIIKGINEDFFGNKEEAKQTIENILLLNNEYYHEYLIYKSMKYNKTKNRIYELIKKKKELEQNNCNNSKDNVFSENGKKNIIYPKNNPINEDNENSSNDIIIPTDVTTENSIFNMNDDSLYFDTDEQIDIEFPENDFSSCYLSSKSLGNSSDVKKKIIVPPLDLKLIKYNLDYRVFSIGEKSLSRNIENDITTEIKKIKTKIKSYIRQNKNLEKKCQKYENKIKHIACFLYSNSKNNNLEKNNNSENK